MIGAMAESTSMPREGASRRLPAVLAGVAGCLVVAVGTAPRYSVGMPPLLATPGRAEYHGLGWLFLAVPIVASALGLCALRWWPYLLLAALLLAVPPMLPAS